MTAIWRNDGSGWSLLSPSGFPLEADLHDLVEHAPQILPLAGSPQLVVVGREVLLGGNKADLIALEPSGRLVVIEIKLASNAEARRAVIAQVLTYAAYLRGLKPSELEQDILRKQLSERGLESLESAASQSHQEGPFDTKAFSEQLQENLEQGHFRLVLVLDAAPTELVRLVGYLDAVADKLLIDLITVSAYRVGDSQIIVPQRVDPERTPERTGSVTQRDSTNGRGYIEGAEEFLREVERAPMDKRTLLTKLVHWARNLEERGLVRLGTYYGKNDSVTLLPRLQVEGVGLVTIYLSGHLQFWRSVFERLAPNNLERIEALPLPIKVGQGNWTNNVTDELLDALTSAYVEAASGRVHLPSNKGSSLGSLNSTPKDHD